MRFLLDTNIISQGTKPLADAKVVAWLNGVTDEELFVSVITLEEIREGIELLPAGKRKRDLDLWLRDELIPRFDDRILPVDAAIADRCGRLVATCKARGVNPDAMDALIAANAIIHGLKMVTLNKRHFIELVVTMVAF